ncbi:MAG: energy transducer TonB [Pseudomonadales bacterium]
MKVAGLLIGALLINLGLYLLMENMIARDPTRVLGLIDAQTIEFVRTPLEDETRTKDRRRKPPPKPQEIKRPRADVENIASRASALPTDVTAFEVTSLLGAGGGVALGQRLVEGTGESMELVMASDLTVISMLPPQYPPSAAMRELEGWVEMVFYVNEDGSVRDPMVVDSRPGSVFNSAAEAAALRWRFRPVVRNGQPVTVRARIHIDFDLPKE